MTVYEPAGELKKGSFALAKSSDAELMRRKKLAEEG